MEVRGFRELVRSRCEAPVSATGIRVALSFKRSEDGDPRREPEGGRDQEGSGTCLLLHPHVLQHGCYEFGTVVLEVEGNRPVGEVGGIQRPSSPHLP